MGVPLGDPHNFGHRVILNDGRLYKPRTLLWEWLFLASKSPLRRLIDEAAARSNVLSPFGIMPCLEYSDPDAVSLIDRGWVRRIEWLPVRQAPDEDDWARLGGVIAMATWFGLGDLHKENVAFGILDGRLIWTPLDIECIFDAYYLPSQTHILPSRITPLAECGMIEPYNLQREYALPVVAAVCRGYVDTLRMLDRELPSIADLLSEIPGIDAVPIRLIPRATRDYYALLNGSRHPGELVPPLGATESEQLARGDIPYIFRTWASASRLYE